MEWTLCSGENVTILELPSRKLLSCWEWYAPPKQEIGKWKDGSDLSQTSEFRGGDGGVRWGWGKRFREKGFNSFCFTEGRVLVVVVKIVWTLSGDRSHLICIYSPQSFTWASAASLLSCTCFAHSYPFVLSLVHSFSLFHRAAFSHFLSLCKKQNTSGGE